MTDSGITHTLAELVQEHPQLTREFERLGLDYCCGGNRSFGEACELQHLNPASLAAELTRTLVAHEVPEWTTMEAPALVRHLVDTHHAYLWAELPRLSALADKVLSAHGARHPELVEIASALGEVRADLEPHLLKEERVLFPMVVELFAADGPVEFHCGSLSNPIGVMLREHDGVGHLLSELRRSTRGYVAPADGCASYVAFFAGLAELEADTHLHIHKENNVLFPMVTRAEAAAPGR